MKQKLVKDYMTKKSQLISFTPETSIYSVIKTLIKKSISGAPVVDSEGNVIGLISEKDCLKVLLNMAMHEVPETTVDKYMSTTVSSINEDKTILDAAQMFRDSVFRRYPVVSGQKLVGIISRRDVLKAIEEMAKR